MANTVIYNHDYLLDYLAKGRNKDSRPSDKHNLRIIRNRDGEPVVRMYSTDIATFHRDGTITLSAGGWSSSASTRGNIWHVARTALHSLPSYKRHRVPKMTRVAVPGLPSGVPFVNGVKVLRGSAVWHPHMAEQGITDIKDMTEEVLQVNKAEAAEYYKARRSLLKKIRPMLSFIDRQTAASGAADFSHDSRDLCAWLQHLLFSPVPDDELMQVACRLVELGAPPVPSRWEVDSFDTSPEWVAEYAQRGVAKCAGQSSWAILRRLGALDTVRVLCKDV